MHALRLALIHRLEATDIPAVNALMAPGVSEDQARMRVLATKLINAWNDEVAHGVCPNEDKEILYFQNTDLSQFSLIAVPPGPP